MRGPPQARGNEENARLLTSPPHATPDISARSLFSVLAALVYAICYVTVTVDWQYAVFSMAMAGTVTCVGLPLMSYLFFCRLRSLKRSHAHHKQ